MAMDAATRKAIRRNNRKAFKVSNRLNETQTSLTLGRRTLFEEPEWKQTQTSLSAKFMPRQQLVKANNSLSRIEKERFDAKKVHLRKQLSATDSAILFDFRDRHNVLLRHRSCSPRVNEPSKVSGKDGAKISWPAAALAALGNELINSSVNKTEKEAEGLDLTNISSKLEEEKRAKDVNRLWAVHEIATIQPKRTATGPPNFSEPRTMRIRDSMSLSKNSRYGKWVMETMGIDVSETVIPENSSIIKSPNSRKKHFLHLPAIDILNYFEKPVEDFHLVREENSWTTIEKVLEAERQRKHKQFLALEATRTAMEFEKLIAEPLIYGRLPDEVTQKDMLQFDFTDNCEEPLLKQPCVTPVDMDPDHLVEHGGK